MFGLSCGCLPWAIDGRARRISKLLLRHRHVLKQLCEAWQHLAWFGAAYPRQLSRPVPLEHSSGTRCRQGTVTEARRSSRAAAVDRSGVARPATTAHLLDAQATPERQPMWPHSPSPASSRRCVLGVSVGSREDVRIVVELRTAIL